MSTKTELIKKARRGDRITKEEAKHSLFDKANNMLAETCQHRNWRPIVCDSEYDIVECAACGTQCVTRCNFDEDMS